MDNIAFKIGSIINKLLVNVGASPLSSGHLNIIGYLIILIVILIVVNYFSPK